KTADNYHHIEEASATRRGLFCPLSAVCRPCASIPAPPVSHAGTPTGRRTMNYRYLFAAALIAAAAPKALNAQGWIDIERRPGIPINTSVFRVSSNVRTRVEGRVATIEVEEQFRNTGGGIAEGTYLYPLPGEAVFQNFSLWMGENEVRGEMMNADQARTIYEGIVRRLRDPALLTLEGHGLIRARVFPIQPGETRRVVLRYTQLLQREGDALRMRYSIGERGPLTSGALNDTPGSGDRFRFR